MEIAETKIRNPKSELSYPNFIGDGNISQVQS